ncbi:MAG: hydrogenase/urease accessory protein HupE [Paracoccaceae bacterium]|jgi:hydrogenase/urease accessory protein HupE
MRRAFDLVLSKLRLWVVLSSVVVLSLAPVAVRAHEVSPTIADLTVEGGILVLDLRLNVEAFLAGIDLDGMSDTNASDQSAQYDALRALGPQDLDPKVRAFAQDWAAQVRIMAGQGADALVPLNVAVIDIPPVGDPELPRASHLILKGPVSAGARSLTLGWPDGAGDLVLRQQGVPDPFTGYIAGGDTSPSIALAGGAAQSAMQVFAGYIPVGFDHILPKGLDHILFVLGLFFLSARLRPLLWQISAFTVAHTVTLALGVTGTVQVDPTIIEPLIAGTIVFVAVENVFTRRLSRWRVLLVFGFGLLHGLGFASVLGDFGLPEQQFFAALIGFNVGVELGQITVIMAAFLAVGVWFRNKWWYRGRIAIPASVVIALIGGYWFVERAFL